MNPLPLSPEAPLVALVQQMHQGRSLAELVNIARQRRARGPTEAPVEEAEDNNNPGQANGEGDHDSAQRVEQKIPTDHSSAVLDGRFIVVRYLLERVPEHEKADAHEKEHQRRPGEIAPANPEKATRKHFLNVRVAS